MLSIEQIHPMVVHFPIVLLLGLAAFDTIGLASGGRFDGRSCIANLSAGLAVLAGLSAGVAYVFGDIAFDSAIAKGIVESRLELHETLGTVTAAVLVLWGLARAVLWWRGRTMGTGLRRAIVALEIAFSILVVTTAFYGGQLVYEFGVNVARAAS